MKIVPTRAVTPQRKTHLTMIRQFETTDTDIIVSVWRAASAVAHPFLPADFIESEADALRNLYLKHAKTRVLVQDNQVVGFAALIGDELAGLFLHPTCHGQGLGRALVDDALKDRDHLDVEVFENNKIGRRFYARYGFRETGRSLHAPSGQQIVHMTTAAL